VGEAGSGNLLIQGDTLLVLGALLMPKVNEVGQVGRLWAERSGRRCVFGMLDAGLNVTQQIDAATARA
jgi:hypothetical protein